MEDDADTGDWRRGTLTHGRSSTRGTQETLETVFYGAGDYGGDDEQVAVISILGIECVGIGALVIECIVIGALEIECAGSVAWWNLTCL
ncbi:hypothetical protein DPX16_19706 [Anabarilius grahami]|uniref:Uncharacterized protein n=1 Tax=Anabarilius grahami TaxID=495550 RepID=A0A3N0XQ07_ANAGA|nr:hypothetical protein DPX16_19706 [Anabarilius grahami]